VLASACKKINTRCARIVPRAGIFERTPVQVRCLEHYMRGHTNHVHIFQHTHTHTNLFHVHWLRHMVCNRSGNPLQSVGEIRRCFPSLPSQAPHPAIHPHTPKSIKCGRNKAMRCIHFHGGSSSCHPHTPKSRPRAEQRHRNTTFETEAK